MNYSKVEKNIWEKLFGADKIRRVGKKKENIWTDNFPLKRYIIHRFHNY